MKPITFGVSLIRCQHSSSMRGALPSLVRLDLHQHIAGEELALAPALLAAAHLDHFLGRHQHFAELVLHAGPRDALRQARATWFSKPE